MLKQELIELLSNLMKCRPVSSDIPAVNSAHDVLRSYLEDRGVFCTTEDIGGRKTLFASTVPDKMPDYLLNAHIDVVPAEESQFTPRIEGSLIYGRGPGDDLGNAVTIAGILCDVLKKHVSAGAVFTADEEIGGSTTAEMVSRGYGAKKCIFVLDAAQTRICIAEKGMISLKLTAYGKGGHASRPWDAENPIEKLFSAYARLREQWINPSPEFTWADSMTVCQVSGGMAHNQIPDSASMVLNIRYVNQGGRWYLLEKVRKLTGLKVQLLEECPPVASDGDHPLLKKLDRINSEVRNIPCGFTRMMGATDARHLKKLGLPIAIMGPDSHGSHSANEYSDMDSMADTMEVLERFMTED